MMYHNGFVLAIKKDGQVLRESNSESPPAVFLPFDSEYSIYVKNNNDRRVSVKFTIDGTNVGSDFVIDARGWMDLERFVLDGDLFKGNKFKFVRSTDTRVQDPTNPVNGIIRAELTLEAPPIYISSVPFYQRIPPSVYYGPSGSVFYGTSYGVHCTGASILRSVSENTGATVEGIASNQTFMTCSFNPSNEAPTVLELRLRGSKVPVTVQATQHKHCTQCGKRMRYKDKFCPNCGTLVTVNL